MKVASIQMSVVEGDKTATIDKAIENITAVKGSISLFYRKFGTLAS